MKRYLFKFFSILIFIYNIAFAETNIINKELHLETISNHLAGIDSKDLEHNKIMSELWDNYYKSNLLNLINWQKDNIENIYKNDCHAFYPFSGPDIIHVMTFLPKCSKFTMVGLEPIGDIANLDIDNINLKYLRMGLYSIFKRSFFVTREMWSDFKLNNKGVTLPLIALARKLDYQIININPIALNHKGDVIKGLQGHNNGVNITLKKGNNIKEIFYFRQNLKNDNKVIEYLKKNSIDVTYLKATQYSLFSPEFSVLKNFILSMSKLIIQDDSGIPYKYFSKDKWNINIYGNYTGPYGNEFKAYKQIELIKLYEAEKPKILPFNLGYGYKRKDSCLMTFSKK